MTPPPSRPTPLDREGWWTRDHALIVVLVAATALLLFLCWRLVQPFISPLAFALALAIIAHPLHRWIARRVSNVTVAAGLAVLVIALAIIGPAVFVGHSVVREATAGAQQAQAALESGKWREQIAQHPRLAGALTQFEQGASLQGLAAQTGKRLTQVVTGSGWVVVELLLTLFVLFYFFRDRRGALGTLRSLVPLSERETDEVFTRVANTIHASIYGTLVVAAVQGALGGLIFWWLGLPAPILWGVVMGLLAIIPVLGAFVIWVPAAIFLAASGQWGKAAILAAWGGIVIALVDNLLYPVLVGKRLRLHTVPVFFSIVGGLALFGTAGLVLGPVVLALTDAILEIWRRRTAAGRPAEEATVTG